MPNFKLWETGNHIMLDFPYFNSGEAGGECTLGECRCGEESYGCTNTGHSEADRTSSHGDTGFHFSSLLPESRSRLNEFHRPSSEFWLFLFLCLLFPQVLLPKATRVVIDWILWFSILLPFRVSSELLKIKLLRNKKQRAMC